MIRVFLSNTPLNLVTSFSITVNFLHMLIDILYPVSHSYRPAVLYGQCYLCTASLEQNQDMRAHHHQLMMPDNQPAAPCITHFQSNYILMLFEARSLFLIQLLTPSEPAQSLHAAPPFMHGALYLITVTITENYISSSKV